MGRPAASSSGSRGDSRLDALGLGEESRVALLADALSDFGRTVMDADGLRAEAEARASDGSGHADAPSGTRIRALHSYAASRVVIGLALVLVQALVWELGSRQINVVHLLCAAYLAEALVLWVALRRRLRSRRSTATGRLSWWGTVGVDVLAFSTLHWFDPVGSLTHAALLVLPALMSGVLGSRLSALATAAASALGLLVMAALKANVVAELPALLSQSGLLGLGLFMMALLAGELAVRLARQEHAAKRSLALALQQAELNRLVIDEMSDGVLVVDRRGHVRAANPAARALLASDGQCPALPFSLHDEPGWRALLRAVEQGYAQGHWPTQGQDLSIAAAGEAPQSVRVRARFTRQSRGPWSTHEEHDETLAVLFAEPLRDVLARQRQERLVAMGRISAGIAHEIRNPLAAIAQANALLQEDSLPQPQQRLVRIVSDNVGRLKRIVDDVMEVAPGAAAPSPALDLPTEVAAICGEWARTASVALGSDSRLVLKLPQQSIGVSFDPDHLRRVLINLLENGLRHASAAPAAVCLSVEVVDDALASLRVASDGEPIPADVEAHLFEPFHSTRSRGTGLGLYICRELCERHGASIEYLRQMGHSHVNVFQVVMRRAAVDAAGRLL